MSGTEGTASGLSATSGTRVRTRSRSISDTRGPVETSREDETESNIRDTTDDIGAVAAVTSILAVLFCLVCAALNVYGLSAETETVSFRLLALVFTGIVATLAAIYLFFALKYALKDVKL